MSEQEGRMDAIYDKYFPCLWEVFEECRGMLESYPLDPEDQKALDGLEERFREFEDKRPEMKYIYEHIPAKARKDMATLLDESLAFYKNGLVRVRKSLIKDGIESKDELN